MESNLFRLDGDSIDICRELNTLVSCITNETETDWDIGEFSECDLASLIAGAFWACTDCHGGQSSDTYETYCILNTIYNPGMTCGPEEDSSEKIAYDTFCEYLLETNTTKEA